MTTLYNQVKNSLRDLGVPTEVIDKVETHDFPEMLDKDVKSPDSSLLLEFQKEILERVLHNSRPSSETSWYKACKHRRASLDTYKVHVLL